jgi:hypothetical protein
VAAPHTPIITVSGKPEIVICTDGEINLISHGVASKVTLVSADGKAKIVHYAAEGKQLTIAEGGTIEMAKAFSDLAAELTRKPEKHRHRAATAAAWTIVALLVGSSAVFTLAHRPVNVRTVAINQGAPDLPVQIDADGPNAAHIGQMIEQLSARRAKLAGEKPDLPVPAAKSGANVAVPPEAIQIPAELPPLATEKTDSAPLDAGKTALKVAPQVAPPTPVATPSSTSGETKAPLKLEEKPSVGVKQPSAEKPSAAITDDVQKAVEATKIDDADVKAAMEEPFPQVNQDAINKAIQKMMARGMSTDEAMMLLTNLQDIGAKGEKVTPDMLSGLPHEVAQVLFESGVIQKSDEDKADSPAGTPYRIIRLPDSIMDNYRGKDGIPTIPERNSWASTGNYVSLPLPGGGDIKSPEVMKEFGLKP